MPSLSSLSHHSPLLLLERQHRLATALVLFILLFVFGCLVYAFVFSAEDKDNVGSATFALFRALVPFIFGQVFDKKCRSDFVAFVVKFLRRAPLGYAPVAQQEG